MNITLKMLGDLRQYLPAGSGFNQGEMQLPDGAKLAQVLAQVKLPDNKAFLLLHNGEMVQEADYADTELKAGDEVTLFPPIKGG